MKVTVRFALYIVLLQFLLDVAVTLVLATQILQFDHAHWIRFAVIAVVGPLIAALLRALTLRRHTLAVDAAGDAETLSAALSQTLRATSDGSNVAGAIGAVLFIALAQAFVLSGWAALVSYAVIAFVTFTQSVVFTYAAAKIILTSESRRLPNVQYSGSRIALGRKLAVIFIGTFIASTATLVQLVTSRVSVQLRKIAVDSSNVYFKDVYDIAARMPGAMSDERLRVLAGYIDPRYSLYALLPDGRLLTAQSRQEGLPPGELAEVAARRDGDSSMFVSPHVLRFQHLGDGSILIIGIPFEAFRAVPRSVAYYGLLVALTTTFVFGASTYFLARDATGPLHRMQQIAAELAEGNFAGHVGIFTDDENGAVVSSLAVTRENLRQLMREVEGNGTAIARRARTMSEGSETLAEAARQQSQLTIASTAAVQGIRAGAEAALARTRAVADRASGVTRGASELASTANEITGRMDTLFSSVEEIAASAQTIGATAELMTGRTEALAGASEDAVSFVAEMDATIEELHRTARATAELSQQVEANATSGAHAVRRTLEGIEVARQTTGDAAAVMNKLAETSQRIAQMLDVIDNVAQRTNLLSLNAAIIAAQAGKDGKGFQIVAEEIRTLSEETRVSAKEIAAVVHSIQSDARGARSAIESGLARVEESVTLAREAAEGLQTIQASATTSLAMSQRTTSSLNEQTSSTRHLHDIIAQLAQHVQDIHGGTREYARGAVSLGRETDRVREVALAVKTATTQQSRSAASITDAMSAVAVDITAVRDHLESQLGDTERIAAASSELLQIAKRNDSIAAGFGTEVTGLADSGREFERAVARFRL